VSPIIKSFIMCSTVELWVCPLPKDVASKSHRALPPVPYDGQ
jgi:hypothetical protein